MRYLILVLAIFGGMMLGGLGLTYKVASAEPTRTTYEDLDLFMDILTRVRSDYVTEAEDQELVEAAIQGMLKSLDPHSSYLPPRGFEDLQVQSSGEYGGLGLEVTTRQGAVQVVTPMDGTPAARVGVEAGDFITGINGKSILGETLSDAIDEMRGPAGSPITITVVRQGADGPIDFTIVREIITIRSITSRIEDENIGYLRVSIFNENTGKLARKAIDEMKAEASTPLTGLILDLRNNPGGLLSQAVEISSLFLDGGEVVSTRGRDPRDIERYNARNGDVLNGLPIVVLINAGSASASEIVAGALQDRERATLIGMQSFGKGSVQSVIPLNGGRDGALRLTTSRYYTPAGRSIQATGIKPDIEISHRRLEKPEDRVTEVDLPNALKNEIDAAIKAKEAEVATNEGEAVDEANETVRTDVFSAEMPPEDYPEDDDYQLKRAKEILGTLRLTGSLVLDEG
ncbi:MAG: S41 family peptidase [Robiginitomaculum sp.]|nr:S41 family peptidase [Robiginitomaculum sp.]